MSRGNVSVGQSSRVITQRVNERTFAGFEIHENFRWR